VPVGPSTRCGSNSGGSALRPSFRLRSGAVSTLSIKRARSMFSCFQLVNRSRRLAVRREKLRMPQSMRNSRIRAPSRRGLLGSQLRWRGRTSMGRAD
jgi:hypothetical protein